MVRQVSHFFQIWQGLVPRWSDDNRLVGQEGKQILGAGVFTELKGRPGLHFKTKRSPKLKTKEGRDEMERNGQKQYTESGLLGGRLLITPNIFGSCYETPIQPGGFANHQKACSIDVTHSFTFRLSQKPGLVEWLRCWGRHQETVSSSPPLGIMRAG